jgi:acyl-CoA synthetase (AMP-forming)/AMP-acid ligase II
MSGSRGAEDVGSPCSTAATMVDVLRWWARHQPQKRAFVYLERGEREAGSLTYAELDRRARIIARAVRERGLTGRRVLLAYPTCLEFVAALFGCFYAGAVAIPTPVDSYDRAASRLRAIMTDADVAAVFSMRSVLDQAGGPVAEAAAHRSAQTVVLATDELGGPANETPPRPPEPGAVALLQYTSGSTGQPRGVMLSHANIVHNERALLAVLLTDVDDVVVNWLPLYHDMGLIGGVLHTVSFGGLCALMPPLAFVQKPLRWLAAIARYRATVSMGPCFAYGLAGRRGLSERAASLDLSSWRVAICGGESVRPRVLEQFAATFAPRGFEPRALMPAYGLAEATLIASAAVAGTGLKVEEPLDVSWGRRLTNCGPAVEGQRVSIVDPLSREPVPPGQRGEVWLQGPCVAMGYWNRPEETHATFQAAWAGTSTHDAAAAGRWLRTGDLGFMSPDGVVITGRAKDLIIIRGANFDPLDVETLACESDPAFEPGAGAAFSIEHDTGEHVVLLHEVRREAARTLDVNVLAGRVIDKVNRSLGLSIYDLVLLHPGTLPRTTSGKIRRHACKDQYLTGGLAQLDEVIEHPGLGRHRSDLRASSPG